MDGHDESRIFQRNTANLHAGWSRELYCIMRIVIHDERANVVGNDNCLERVRLK